MATKRKVNLELDEDDVPSRVEADTPVGKFSATSKRMAELIAILSLSATAVLAYAFYQHDVNSKQTASETVTVLKTLTESLRMNSCLLAQSQEARQSEFSNPNSFCARMSKI